MSDSTMIDLLRTAIAYIRSLIQPSTPLFLEVFTGLITGWTGSTFNTAKKYFSAGIGPFTMITMNAEVFSIVERAFVIPVGKTVRSNFFGYCSRIFAKKCCDIFKRSTFG